MDQEKYEIVNIYFYPFDFTVRNISRLTCKSIKISFFSVNNLRNVFLYWLYLKKLNPVHCKRARARENILWLKPHKLI